MHHRVALAISVVAGGVGVAFAWLWIGPGSYQPCHPAPFWDDLAVWVSANLGAGETDGPAGAPAFCEIPTDLTWLGALGMLLLAVAAAVWSVVSGRNLDSGQRV